LSQFYDLAPNFVVDGNSVTPTALLLAEAALARTGDADWKFLGVGGGETRPEKFELRDLGSADQVRIVFKDPRDVEITKPLKPYPKDYAMGIDAVEGLH